MFDVFIETSQFRVDVLKKKKKSRFVSFFFHNVFVQLTESTLEFRIRFHWSKYNEEKEETVRHFPNLHRNSCETKIEHFSFVRLSFFFLFDLQTNKIHLDKFYSKPTAFVIEE